MAGPDARAREAIERLAGRYGLPAGAAERLLRLFELLTEDPQAPTAIKDARAVLEDHLADSLVALELEQVRDASSLVDIGSGAGLPGVPLAIALPAASVTLLESSSRKCHFIERVLLNCGTANATVVHARAESWPAGLGRFDVATARALAPLEVVVEYAAPLLALGGTLVAWRGKRDPAGEAAAAHGAELVGMAAGPVLAVRPYAGAEHRHLHLASKVMETPAGFPRRPGAAQKRPLSELSRRP